VTESAIGNGVEVAIGRAGKKKPVSKATRVRTDEERSPDLRTGTFLQLPYDRLEQLEIHTVEVRNWVYRSTTSALAAKNHDNRELGTYPFCPRPGIQKRLGDKPSAEAENSSRLQTAPNSLPNCAPNRLQNVLSTPRIPLKTNVLQRLSAAC
jgi:hypothetical protein